MHKTRYSPSYVYDLDFSKQPGLARTVDNMISSRRGSRPLGQTLFLALTVIVFVYGIYTYFELKKMLDESSHKNTKYQQQQDSLTAQLQVVYEHRSRLEKALQVAKSEQKKSKDLYDQKIDDAKQEHDNRYSALHIQHKMLRSQFDDIQEEIDKLKETNRDLQNRIEQQKEDHEDTRAKLQDESNKRIQLIQSQLADTQDSLEQVRSRHQQAEYSVRQLQNDLDITKNERDQYSKQIEGLVMQVNNHQNNNARLQAQLDELSQRHVQYQQNMDKMSKYPAQNNQHQQQQQLPQQDKKQQILQQDHLQQGGQGVFDSRQEQIRQQYMQQQLKQQQIPNAQLPQLQQQQQQQQLQQQQQQQQLQQQQKYNSNQVQVPNNQDVLQQQQRQALLELQQQQQLVQQQQQLVQQQQPRQPQQQVPAGGYERQQVMPARPGGQGELPPPQRIFDKQRQEILMQRYYQNGQPIRDGGDEKPVEQQHGGDPPVDVQKGKGNAQQESSLGNDEAGQQAVPDQGGEVEQRAVDYRAQEREEKGVGDESEGSEGHEAEGPGEQAAKDRYEKALQEQRQQREMQQRFLKDRTGRLVDNRAADKPDGFLRNQIDGAIGEKQFVGLNEPPKQPAHERQHQMIGDQVNPERHQILGEQVNPERHQILGEQVNPAEQMQQQQEAVEGRRVIQKQKEEEIEEELEMERRLDRQQQAEETRLRKMREEEQRELQRINHKAEDVGQVNHGRAANQGAHEQQEAEHDEEMGGVKQFDQPQDDGMFQAADFKRRVAEEEQKQQQGQVNAVENFRFQQEAQHEENHVGADGNLALQAPAHGNLENGENGEDGGDVQVQMPNHNDIGEGAPAEDEDEDEGEDDGEDDEEDENAKEADHENNENIKFGRDYGDAHEGRQAEAQDEDM